MIRKCISCGKEFEYDNPEDLKEWFYRTKGSDGSKKYYQKKCKECVKANFREKYKSGVYKKTAARLRDDISYYDAYSNIGIYRG